MAMPPAITKKANVVNQIRSAIGNVWNHVIVVVSFLSHGLMDMGTQNINIMSTAVTKTKMDRKICLFFDVTLLKSRTAVDRTIKLMASRNHSDTVDRKQGLWGIMIIFCFFASLESKFFFSFFFISNAQTKKKTEFSIFFFHKKTTKKPSVTFFC